MRRGFTQLRAKLVLASVKTLAKLSSLQLAAVGDAPWRRKGGSRDKYFWNRAALTCDRASSGGPRPPLWASPPTRAGDSTPHPRPRNARAPTAPPGAAAQATAVAPRQTVADGAREPRARRPAPGQVTDTTAQYDVQDCGGAARTAEVARRNPILKKRQRTPPSADRRDRPELPWTDQVQTSGKGTYGEVYRARPDDARRRTQGARRRRPQELIQRDDDWGFPITTLREHKILLQLRHANLIRLHRQVFSPDPRSIGRRSSWSSNTRSSTWRS